MKAITLLADVTVLAFFGGGEPRRFLYFDVASSLDGSGGPRSHLSRKAVKKCGFSLNILSLVRLKSGQRMFGKQNTLDR